MKALKFISTGLVALSLVAAASAAKISGTVSFTGGNFNLDAAIGSATAVTGYSGVQSVGAATGDFSGSEGSIATFNTFSFGDVGFDLWSFVWGADTYTLDVSSMLVEQNTALTPDTITISGNGLISSAGVLNYEESNAVWNITSQGTGITTLTFSAYAETVPDSSATALLLGLGLVGLGAAARRLKK